MRRTIAALMTVLVATAGAPGRTQNVAETDARKRIEAQYEKMAQAFRQKDAHAFCALLAPDAEILRPDGRPFRGPAIEANLKQQFAQIRAVKAMRYTLDSVRADGNRALVRVTGKSSVQIDGEAGKSHTLDQTNTVDNTWTRTPQGWRILRAETVAVQVWVDGERLPDVAVMPKQDTLLKMVRTSLLDWNRAVQSGDFAAFHAGLAKPFRDKYAPEQLKQTFLVFAEKKIDIAPIADVEAALQPAPAIDDNGVLTVIGRYPTKPASVRFNLDYKMDGGAWRLLGINVKTE